PKRSRDPQPCPTPGLISTLRPCRRSAAIRSIGHVIFRRQYGRGVAPPPPTNFRREISILSQARAPRPWPSNDPFVCLRGATVPSTIGDGFPVRVATFIPAVAALT